MTSSGTKRKGEQKIVKPGYENMEAKYYSESGVVEHSANGEILGVEDIHRASISPRQFHFADTVWTSGS